MADLTPANAHKRGPPSPTASSDAGEADSAACSIAHKRARLDQAAGRSAGKWADYPYEVEDVAGWREEDGEGEGLRRKAVRDGLDGVFRCGACCSEVMHGVCQGCRRAFVEDAAMKKAEAEHDYTNTSILASLDRLPPSSPPALSGTALLLSLGCTHAFISRYSITYLPAHGLIATADASLRSFFDIHPTQTASLPAADGSGPVEVLLPRPWKIHLGRRVQLSPSDGDGSAFMHDLLDEVLDHQAGLGDGEGVSPDEGVEWVTRVEKTYDPPQEGEDGEACWEGTEEWVTRRRELVDGDEDSSSSSTDELSSREEDDGPDPRAYHAFGGFIVAYDPVYGYEDSAEETPSPAWSGSDELDEEEDEDARSDSASLALVESAVALWERRGAGEPTPLHSTSVFGSSRTCAAPSYSDNLSPTMDNEDNSRAVPRDALEDAFPLPAGFPSPASSPSLEPFTGGSPCVYRPAPTPYSDPYLGCCGGAR
ncbi:hypothetical protein JCM10213_001086 [Rhodosporidiobolus nylandii]